MLRRGLRATVNSDDPAYFGGYAADNYIAAQKGLRLTRDEVVSLAKNSVEASFLDDRSKRRLLDEIERASKPN